MTFVTKLGKQKETQQLFIRDVAYRGSGMTVTYTDDTTLEAVYDTATGRLIVPGIRGEYAQLLEEFNSRADPNIRLDKRFNADGGTRLLVQSIEDEFFRFLPYRGVLELWKYTRKKSGPHVKKFAPNTVYTPRLGKRYRLFRTLGPNQTQLDSTLYYRSTNRKRQHWYQFAVVDSNIRYFDPNCYRVQWDNTLARPVVRIGGQFQRF